MRNVLVLTGADGKTLYVERLALRKGTVYATKLSLTDRREFAATFSDEAVEDATAGAQLLGLYPTVQRVRNYGQGMYYEAYA